DGFCGFILLGPILLSSHVTAIAAVSFGAGKMKTVVYVTISIIIWTATLAVLAYFGMDLLGLEEVQYLDKYLKLIKGHKRRFFIYSGKNTFSSLMIPTVSISTPSTSEVFTPGPSSP